MPLNQDIQSLLSEIDRRFTDGVLEKSNADLLKKLIANSDSYDEALKIAVLGTASWPTGYYFDKRLERTGTDIQYLKRNEALSFGGEGEVNHKLIIGDNYPALLNLLITHRGKIDVIYIDPPYGKDSMGEFAKTNYENRITRDNLLSMLCPRLMVAKELLSEDGVIFCSIDDRNQAHVKLLFDEVFGEGNFISNFVWLNSSSNETDEEIKVNGANAGNLKSGYEYVLVYAKNKSLFSFNLKEPNEEYLIREITKNGNAISSFVLPKGTKIRTKMTKTFTGSINGAAERINIKNGVLDIIDGVIQNDTILEGPFGSRNRWIEDFLKGETVHDSKGQKILGIDFTKSGGFRVIKEKHGDIISNIITNVGSVQGENKNLKNIAIEFSFPKPLNLMKYIYQISTNKGSIILDFFAGSGTTGQAVLELNREDGGHRQFILCTNNEKTELNPNGIAIDVTSERLKRVMTGSSYSGSSDFPWIKKNKPYGDSLDVFDIASVPSFSQTDNSPLDVIDETCYDMDKFTDIHEKFLWIGANFERTIKTLDES